MKAKSSTSFKGPTAALILFVILVTTFVGAQAFINGSHDEPTPTLKATAVVLLPTSTATEAATLTATVVRVTNEPRSTAVQSTTPAATRPPLHTPTRTPVPTATPTSRPQQYPTLPPLLTLDPNVILATPATAIPTPVPTFEVPAGVTNVLLLGRDSPLDDDRGRTDTLIIVAINRTSQTASMISLPRDLYVYLPGRGMDRINNVMNRGGPEFLKSVILYNFGVPIHYYAMIDFDGFKKAVDVIGGVEMVVSCGYTVWMPKSYDLDLKVEENWRSVRLEPGVYQMDSELAFWYVRTRNSLNADWSRSRRQQQLLRAMMNQSIDLNMIAQAPALYSTFNSMVETDMDIGRALQLAAIAPNVRQNGVQHLFLAGKTQSWSVPVAEGEVAPQVLLPVWEGSNMMGDTFRRLFTLSALNRSTRPAVTVEIINATGKPEMDRLAADNLSWYGFVPVITTAEPAQTAVTTTIQYFAQNFKGSSEHRLLSWIFGKQPGHVTLVPDTPYSYNYRIVLGSDYNSCTDALYAPSLQPEP
jgi:polyisoprenyl-teichoic acid--peptidoglycan teichoic acid transferase